MPEKLLTAEELLAALFTDESRPSIRWLREQTANRTIPYVKLGRLVFFDLDQVRLAIQQKRTVNRR